MNNRIIFYLLAIVIVSCQDTTTVINPEAQSNKDGFTVSHDDTVFIINKVYKFKDGTCSKPFFDSHEGLLGYDFGDCANFKIPITMDSYDTISVKKLSSLDETELLQQNFSHLLELIRKKNRNTKTEQNCIPMNELFAPKLNPIDYSGPLYFDNTNYELSLKLNLKEPCFNSKTKITPRMKEDNVIVNFSNNSFDLNVTITDPAVINNSNDYFGWQIIEAGLN